MSTHPDDLTTRLRHSLERGAAPDLSAEIVTGAADHAAPRIITPARRFQLVGSASALVAVAVIGGIALGSTAPRPPLFTAAQGAPASGARSMEAGASSDLRIGKWVDYRYSAGAGLSTSGGTGSVYQLVRTGSPEKRAIDIASVFGVSGTATKAQYSDPAYPTWIVGAADTSAASVAVTWAGAGDWWFSAPAANPISSCDLAAVGPEEPTPGCAAAPQVTTPQVTTPSAAPTEPEARALARTIFATTGFDVAEKDILVTADASQTSATAHLVVDGVVTALEWGVNWSNTGAISSAYGHSIKVVDRGSYGTVSAVAAVNRIADGRWNGSPGPAYQGDARALAADGVLSAAPKSDQQIEPAPGVSPKPVEVTIEQAESTLLLLWDSSGDSWLVPGFALRVSEGWWSSVVSLVPGVVELPQPITVSPDTIDTPASTP